MTPRPARSIAVGFAGLGLIGALAGCASGAAEATGSGTGTGTYHDGTYTEDGSYLSPAGEQTVTVKVTLAANKVTAIAVTPHATDPTAKQYQAKFVGGVAAVVVGKNIDELNVSRVAGSSLTSGGFNKAIDAIKTDARA